MYRKLAEFLEKGDTVCLATVIRTRGSVPREVGAKMIIHPEGLHAGTVGGGCGEAAVMRTALDVLSTGNPTIMSVDLTGEVTMESPAICGGVMDVFIERVPSPRFGSPMLQALLDAASLRKLVSLTTVVSAPMAHAHVVGNKVLALPGDEPLGQLGLGELESHALIEAQQALRSRRHRLAGYANYSNDSAQKTSDSGSVSAPAKKHVLRYTKDAFWCFTEVLTGPLSLVIVGAGHIAQPLAQLGRLCGFSITVLDDRTQFANRQRFPHADKVLAGPMSEGLSSLPLDRDTYVVLITRGHQHDVECLLEIIDTPLAYVGMIGSRRRVRGVFELLQEEYGIRPAALQRVFAPIGLDIGAKTPAEIAVSIMSEIIKVHRGGKVASLSDSWRQVEPRPSEEH